MNSAMSFGIPAKNIALNLSTSTPCEMADVATIFLRDWSRSGKSSSGLDTAVRLAHDLLNFRDIDAAGNQARMELGQMFGRGVCGLWPLPPERVNDLVAALLVGYVGERDPHQIQQGEQNCRISPSRNALMASHEIASEGVSGVKALHESLRDLLRSCSVNKSCHSSVIAR